MNIEDFITFVIKIFKKKRMPFIVHGAIALSLYGHRRMTEDFDVIVTTSEKKVIETFMKEGFKKRRSQMTEDGVVHRLEKDVWYLDVFIEAKRSSWLGLRSRAKKIKWKGMTVLIISKKDLIERKRRRSSHKDLIDIHVLEHMR